MAEILKISPGTVEERNEALRQKIVNAVVSIITEGGYAAATPQRIAERADLSLDVVRKFGDKTQLLDAVLEHCHVVLLQLVENEALSEGSLEERVAMFIALSWRHYQSKLYLAAMEVVLATRSQRDVLALVHLTEQQAVRHREQIRKIFPDSPLNDRELTEVLVTIHCFLTGLTMEIVMEPHLSNIGGYLRRISKSMVAMLQG